MDRDAVKDMTKRTLNISDDVSVPLDAVTGTFCIVGIRGSGKSNTAVVFAEEMLRAKQQIIALDPKDDWHGIRSSADGLSEGLPITILGGTHQDAPLEYTAGALVAQLAIEERISLIISTKHLSDGHRFRFTYDFCDYLYKHCREPMHLFLDEADQFAPQEKQTRIRTGDTVSEAMMLGLVRRVIKQGRTSGLGISLITQSPATLDKRVMNMCETLIAMRIIGKQDFDAVEGWFQVFLRKKEDLEDIVSKLPTLKAGVGVFYSPAWLEVSKIVRFRMAETFDSRKTPKVGERRVEPKVLAPVDLKQLSERMAATIEKVKSEDPTELRRINTGLRLRIAALEAEASRRASVKPDPAVIEKPVIKVVEKLVIEDSQIKRLETLAGTFSIRLDGIIGTTSMLREFKLSLDELLKNAASINGAVADDLSTRKPASETLHEKQTAGYQPNETVRQITQQLDARVSSGSSNGEEYDMADFEEFYRKTVQRLQQDGFAVTVKVEPKEVVLKQFQQAEVDRILAETESLGDFAKQSLKWLESRGGRASKAEILRAVTGKSAEATSGSVRQDRYKQIEDLVDLGLVNKDSNGLASSVTTTVAARLAAYNASASDAEDVVGQVLLRLK